MHTDPKFTKVDNETTAHVLNLISQASERLNRQAHLVRGVANQVIDRLEPGRMYAITPQTMTDFLDYVSEVNALVEAAGALASMDLILEARQGDTYFTVK